MHGYEDCFTKRYANFYSLETVKEKTRQVKKEEFLGKIQYWKCKLDVNMRSNSKSVIDVDIKMKIMIKTDIKLKNKYRVDLIDRHGEVCDKMIIVGNPVHHENLLCPGEFGNLCIYLADFDG